VEQHYLAECNGVYEFYDLLITGWFSKLERFFLCESNERFFDGCLFWVFFIL